MAERVGLSIWIDTFFIIIKPHKYPVRTLWIKLVYIIPTLLASRNKSSLTKRSMGTLPLHLPYDIAL